jgi:hypothetical protein
VHAFAKKHTSHRWPSSTVRSHPTKSSIPFRVASSPSFGSVIIWSHFELNSSCLLDFVGYISTVYDRCAKFRPGRCKSPLNHMIYLFILLQLWVPFFNTIQFVLGVCPLLLLYGYYHYFSFIQTYYNTRMKRMRLIKDRKDRDCQE